MPLSKDELMEWMASPTTQKVVGLIKTKKEQAKEDLGRGLTVKSASMEQTAIETARLVGIIQGLEVLLDIEADDDVERLR
jgi:hypothetical protein